MPNDILAKFQIITGNITEVKADAIVNATDSQFSGSGGIDRAIQKAAGSGLTQRLQTMPPLEAGKAAVTPAFALTTAKQIIHTVGPKWETGFRAEEYRLAECYRSSLRLAIGKQLTSIAFPCISVGANGFPASRAAEIALRTVFHALRSAEDASCIGEVFFVCSSEEKAAVYRYHLKKMIISVFLEATSPESLHDIQTDTSYFTCMRLLGQLEWGDVSHYDSYCKAFTVALAEAPAGNYTTYDRYALHAGSWDYSTCLAYIIFLQRSAYWSGGISAPHFDQCQNGTIRRLLLRMDALLG